MLCPKEWAGFSSLSLFLPAQFFVWTHMCEKAYALALLIQHISSYFFLFYYDCWINSTLRVDAFPGRYFLFLSHHSRAHMVWEPLRGRENYKRPGQCSLSFLKLYRPVTSQKIKIQRNLLTGHIILKKERTLTRAHLFFFIMFWPG